VGAQIAGSPHHACGMKKLNICGGDGNSLNRQIVFRRTCFPWTEKVPANVKLLKSTWQGLGSLSSIVDLYLLVRDDGLGKIVRWNKESETEEHVGNY